MMRKRAVSLILCLCMALSLLPIPTLAVESDADADVMATVFSNDSGQDESKPEAATKTCFIDEFGRVSYKPQVHASETADSQEERPSLMAPTSKLAPPTNLKWETQARTYYEQRDYGSMRVDICVGSISWTDTVNSTREYEIEIYNEKGDSVCSVGHNFSNFPESTSFNSDVFLTDVEESGTYRFSVRAVNNLNWNLSSAPAYSDTWTYTKPSAKLPTPTGLNLNNSILKWNAVSNADGYEVEVTYSQSLTGEKEFYGGDSGRNGSDDTETDVSFYLSADADNIEYGYDGRYHHFRVRSLSNDITKICNSPWSDYLTYDCNTGTVVQGGNNPGQGDDTPDTPIEVSDKVVKSSNLTLQSVTYEYTAGGRIAEMNKDAVGGLEITSVVADPANVCEVRIATWSETLWSDSEINSEVASYISAWKEPGKTLQSQTMPFTATNSRPVRETELGKTEYVLLIARDSNMDAVGYAVIQVEIPAGESVDPVSSYVSFYPENGATYDFENPSNGTSSTNYEDGKLRIFFNKEVASISGRAQLDFSVGTLQIHRASDNQVVYALSESPTIPGVSTNCSLWGTNSPYQAVRLENVQSTLEHGMEYYVTIPAGFFKFSDGTHCSELAKGAWIFETPAEIECHQPLEQIGDFKFRSMIATDYLGIEHDMSYDYKYDEKWFLKDSTEYQHGLVQMSIRAAMAAYGTGDTASNEDNIKSLIESLKFADIVPSYVTPSANSIGYAIGSKNIVSPTGEKFALLMVAVRGGGYYDEWGGNFTVGDHLQHEGFSLAAATVLSGIQDYLNSYKSSLVTKKKIWVMGYSRGAAVTNLVAKELDDGYISGVAPKDVYAFCFECPQNTKDANYSNARYANIVNVVNPIDVVPKVAMSDWGFRRYGTTFYTPYKAGLIGGKYSPLEKRMVENYERLLEQNKSKLDDLRKEWLEKKPDEDADKKVPGKIQYLIPGNNYQAPILEQLTSGLADIFQSTSYYTSVIQNDMVNIAVKNFGVQNAHLDRISVPIGDKDIPVGQAIKVALFISEAIHIVDSISGGNKLKIALGVSAVTDVVILYVAGGKVLFDVGDIALAHYAELCMAWLDSLNGDYEYDFSAPKYRLVYINCPVDVAVYDSNGTLVGNILDDVVQDIEDGVVAYIDADGQKVITLPIDEEYKVDITATSDGSMTYTATEYSMDTASTENLVSYHDIAVEEGTQLTGTVGKMEDDAVTTYSLTKGEEELTPDVSVSGDGVKEYTVTVNKSGNGNAIGGGKYLSGEFSQVTATANSGETFLGWYRGDAQLSTDSEYRFCVTEDMTITAKFTSNTSDSGNTPSGSGISGGSGGSGSGGGSHSESYSITVPSKSQGGQVVSDSSSAKSGKIVTLTVTPDNGYELDSLSVKYGKNKEVALEDKGNGEYTFSMPARNVTVEVLFKASPQDTTLPDTGDTDIESQPNEPIQTNPFSDVTESAYYYDAVMWAVANNVTNGRTPTTFEPGMSCTRAQTVTFLWRVAGSPEPVSNENPFSDISENAYFYKAVLWAVEQGITKGTTVTTFAPGNTVSRAQVVTFLYRSANSPSVIGSNNPFTDVAQNSYYHDAVTWASETGVTQGRTPTTFNPSEDCNRGQIVTFLYRHFVK